MTDTPLILPRTAGKRGRRQVQRRPTMRLANFKAEPPAPPPPKGDVTNGITQWDMLGNDQFGCCGPAATEHNRMAKAATGAGQNGTGKFRSGFVVPSTADTLALYFAYGRAMGYPSEPGAPGPDQGVENGTWFAFLKQAGVIELFAELDPTNRAEVYQSMLDYKGVVVGCLLTDSAESEFESGRPWDVSATEPIDPTMGHDICLVKYDTTSDDAAEDFVSWGALQGATVHWEQAETVDMDAWAIFTQEDAERTGVDSGALDEQIRGIEVDYSDSLVREVTDWLRKHFPHL